MSNAIQPTQTRPHTRLLFALFILGIFCLTTAVSAETATVEQPTSGKIEAGLLNSAETNGTATYFVFLTDQADLSAAYNIKDRTERGEYVVDTLQTVATQSQTRLLRQLRAQQRVGAVVDFRSFFIVNALLVTSDAETISRLAQLPEVERIESEKLFEMPTIDGRDQRGKAPAIEWGITQIGADDVWSDFNTTGEGIIVANIDTGVDIDHPALIDQYRGWTGSTFDHDHNFYDATGDCGGSPCDDEDHGTHTMGTMVGDDGGTNQIGVAPGATWIAAKACESILGGICTESNLFDSAEWMLAPCDFGDNPGDTSCDASKRPHIVSNSWNKSVNYQPLMDAWQAADIFPVFSAGNGADLATTDALIRTPADLCNVTAVGATDSNDLIAYFSSRGPGNYNNCEDKPDLVAPGVNVRSAIDGGGYANDEGTSMAAPHVAGCMALLRSLDTDMSYGQIYAVLVNTAVDLGDAGFDYDYGYGRLDCHAAAAQVADNQQYPWQSNENGTLYTNRNWQHAMGYHFTPQVDGEVVELCGFFNGTKIVRLFNKATGDELVETTVTAANSWSCTSITPVAVSTGVTYTVAAYLDGTGAAYWSTNDQFPQTYDNIRIEGGTNTYTGANPEARPTNNLYFRVQGVADISFVPTPPVETPWQSNENGTLYTNRNWQHAMGYHFTPLADGTIDELCGYFNGTKTVRLFNRNSGATLVTTTVTSANSWSCTSITPVAVTNGQQYTVAVYLAGSGGSMRRFIDNFPQTYNSVRIDASTHTWTGNNPNRRPTNNRLDRMYGMVDIRFTPN